MPEAAYHDEVGPGGLWILIGPSNTDDCTYGLGIALEFYW
jgi:hypothetical protein